MTNSRKIIDELEASGRYLFHGSPTRVEILEPRQAYSNGQINGPPAVAATELADQAIFKSLLPRDSGWSGTSAKNMSYFASPSAMQKAQEAKGYVYVFKREGFELYGRNREWRSEQPVKPTKVIEVGFTDLPKGIKVHN